MDWGKKLLLDSFHSQQCQPCLLANVLNLSKVKGAQRVTTSTIVNVTLGNYWCPKMLFSRTVIRRIRLNEPSSGAYDGEGVKKRGEERRK